MGASQEFTEEDAELIREMYNCRKRIREETKVLPHRNFEEDWYQNVVNFVNKYYLKNNESHKSQLVFNFMKSLKGVHHENVETFFEEKNLTVTMPHFKAAIQKFFKAGNITMEEIRQLNSFGIALKQVFVQNMIILFDLKQQVVGASKLEACEVFGMPVD